MQKFKWISFVLMASLVVLSCGKNDNEDTKKSDGFDMAKLLTPEMVKNQFHLDDTVSLTPDFGTTANYISYDVNADLTGEGKSTYSVSLNFYSSTPSTPSALDAMWESQNNGIYKDRDIQTVSGVGRKASWTTLGGGQLRVITDKYLFYVTIMFGEKSVKKDIAIALAKEIVPKL